MLSVKDIRVAGAGDYGMRPLLPTQAGDEPLASRSRTALHFTWRQARLRAHSRARGFRSMNSRRRAKDPPLTPNC